jgi:UDP-N-acetylmuramoyl-L-alanyl-D-glutamate--2,6-diaminopimelate ligase
MKLVYERFPRLERQGRVLIWDSRQAPSGGPEDVFLISEDPLVLAQLRARSGARTIGATGGGADVEHLNPARLLGEWAHEAAGRPSEKMKLVAFTGTNGKSTSVEILRALLCGVGMPVLQVGTLGVSLWRPGARAPEIFLDTGFTTPEAPAFHALLASALAAGVRACVFECSSHALQLERVAGLDVDVGVFTNLTQDHLDFHGSMEAYGEAKALLFTQLIPAGTATKVRAAVINTGDAFGAKLFARLPIGIQARSFDAGSNLRIRSNTLNGLVIELEDYEYRAHLVGDFNAENLAGALLAAECLAGEGARAEFQAALDVFAGTRGRLERVGDSRIFVDYAHTPDALERTLKTLASLKESSARLFAVFGCGGNRDPGKRPIMGELAARLADQLVITSDNPRDEDPEAIIAAIRAGVRKIDAGKVSQEPDRRIAIRKAVAQMSANDVLAICGKGHETYQIVRGVKHPFDDAAEAQMALAQRFGD